MQAHFQFTIDSLSGTWNIIRIILDEFHNPTEINVYGTADRNDRIKSPLIRVLGGIGSFTKTSVVTKSHEFSLLYEEQVKYLDIAVKANQTYVYRLSDTQLFIDFPNDRFTNSTQLNRLVNSDPQKTSKSSNLPGKPFCSFNLAQLDYQSKIIAERHVCGKDNYDISLHNHITQDLYVIFNEILEYYHKDNLNILTNQAQEKLSDYQSDLSYLVNQKNNLYDCFVNQAEVKGPVKQYTTYTIYYKLK